MKKIFSILFFMILFVENNLSSASLASYAISSTSFNGPEKDIVVLKEEAKQKLVQAKILAMSTKEISDFGSSPLFEAASVGSYDAFLSALTKNVKFDILLIDSLLLLIKSRLEYYKIKNITDSDLLRQANLLLKYVEHVHAIQQFTKSIDILPEDIQNIIYSYYSCNSDEFLNIIPKENQINTKTCCIIS